MRELTLDEMPPEVVERMTSRERELKKLRDEGVDLLEYETATTEYKPLYPQDGNRAERRRNAKLARKNRGRS